MGLGASILGPVGGAIGGYFSGGTGTAVGAGIGTALGGAIDKQQADNQQMSFDSDQAVAAWERSRVSRQTAYQDTVADLKAAGLNPMLAVTNGATSLPTSSAASFSNSGAVAEQADAALQTSSANVAKTRQETRTEYFRSAIAQNDAIKGNYAVSQLAGALDAAMRITKTGSTTDAFAALEEPRIKAGLAELRAALASAKNDAQVYEALNSKAVQMALDVLGRLTGSGSAIAGAVDRYRARSQRGDIINLNKD